MKPPQGMHIGELPVCEQLRRSRGFVSVDQAFLTARRDPARDLALRTSIRASAMSAGAS